MKHRPSDVQSCRLVKHYLLRDLNQLGVDPSEFIRLDVYLLSVYNLIIQRPDGSSGMLDISLSSGVILTRIQNFIL